MTRPFRDYQRYYHRCHAHPDDQPVDYLTATRSTRTTARSSRRGAPVRQEIEEKTALAVAPSHPSEFLQALVKAVRRKALALEEALDAAGEDVRDEISDTIDAITEDADDAKEQLTEVQFGSFSVLNAALEFNYSQKVHSVRRFRNLYADSLSEEAAERVNELLDVLEFFGPAREDIKTLYFQWGLTNLSRGILYTGIPALVGTYFMILFFEPREFPEITFGIPDMLWIVSLGVTIGTLPFLVLVAYVLRIATVAKRTAAIGPLVLRTTDQEGEIEWTDGST